MHIHAHMYTHSYTYTYRETKEMEDGVERSEKLFTLIPVITTEIYRLDHRTPVPSSQPASKLADWTL